MLPIEPVAIWEKGHIKRVLSTVEGAGRCLTLHWPGDRRRKPYIAACTACLAALEGTGTATEARAAIIRAAMDAGILADNPKPQAARREKPRRWPQ